MIELKVESKQIRSEITAERVLFLYHFILFLQDDAFTSIISFALKIRFAYHFLKLVIPFYPSQDIYNPCIDLENQVRYCLKDNCHFPDIYTNNFRIS